MCPEFRSHSDACAKGDSAGLIHYTKSPFQNGDDRPKWLLQFHSKLSAWPPILKVSYEWNMKFFGQMICHPTQGIVCHGEHCVRFELARCVQNFCGNMC